jgi:hypothetical protein
MTTSPSNSAAGWTLHVHERLGCCATLEYVFEDGIRCSVDIPPALSSFVLALITARALDVRNAAIFMVGSRRLAEIGKMVRRMPGPGNAVSENAIGGYKRALIRLVRQALKARSLEVGRKLDPPMPVINPAYSHGYSLAEEGVAVRGVAVHELLSSLLNH